jgi:hypothetical protein
VEKNKRAAIKYQSNDKAARSELFGGRTLPAVTIAAQKYIVAGLNLLPKSITRELDDAEHIFATSKHCLPCHFFQGR